MAIERIASRATLISDELAGYAKEELDVLAMGWHGYGAFKGAVLGSVATRVVAHGEIPLVLIGSVAR
jgi:nucleotide-binding universal stress UspA family protein